MQNIVINHCKTIVIKQEITYCLQSCGREAEQFLQYICSNNVVPDESRVGTIVHTGMLNNRGGYEMDCSVVRLSYNRFVFNFVHCSYVYIGFQIKYDFNYINLLV